ncbi:hypothetical protein G8770_00225 [Aestuariicella hydrocarbonica]|uniref:Uncharacterized protein n=1 Tax=Pseudomaricurvus hydrocarbonicus TaxID=1470433 RepID=A0A9E5JP28_9GAMM|nr:hypothetical protein [Aestuariicella hydrocarbonica]NHO63972.1 hypothetical protein [Aestuariicella hydrocarbonica]
MTGTAALFAVIVTVTGCSGMSRRDKNTAVGAVIGHEVDQTFGKSNLNGTAAPSD